MYRPIAAGIALLAVSLPCHPQDTKTVEQLAEQLKPSLCVITSRGREAKTYGLGTGFVVSEDGLIATNLHVVGEGRALTVEFPDGRKFDAITLHAHESKRDMAIIKIDAKGLKPIPLGDAGALKDGQAVVALGNPKGLKYSVVSGVVSSVREMDGRRMIQLAIPVEPGNSGGPVVDMKGRVVGIMTFKSLVTENLGFAGVINDLQDLLKKPNPVPMAAWVTIGALDPDEWKTELGGRWTQRAGRIRVEGAGTGFGGRSYCVLQKKAPAVPYEVAVTVKLDDEAGAAGIIFKHDGDRHYGFYPTGGKLRLTRFDGSDVYSWKILFDKPSAAYKPEESNVLRVRVEKDKIKCYVNDQLVVESDDAELKGDAVGIAKFRETKAEFRGFRVGKDLADKPNDRKAVLKLLEGLNPTTVPNELLSKLAKDPAGTDVLREQARDLEEKAAKLRRLASSVQQRRVYDELAKILTADEAKIDLFHAALLLARLDSEEVDVESYRRDFERMGAKLATTLPKGADDAAKLKALNAYFFDNRGFHGSRGDYYNRSNSYLNEVLDDREGLPITLSVLYMELARRIGLNVVGIGLPGHFVVRHMPKEGEGAIIDVYERGELITVEDAKKKSAMYTGAPVAADLLKPVTRKAIVIRMLHNLLGVAQREKDTVGGLRYLDGLLMLDPTQAQERLMRAGILLTSDRKKEALADIDYLLEHGAEGVDMRRLKQLRESIAGE